jgi:uracil-DNA glycosylase family 4
MNQTQITTLVSQIQSCVKCSLWNQRTNAVPAEAGSNYKEGGLAIFAEAPGHDEDVLGRPMVGRAGKLLDGLLVAGGLSRSDVLVINRVRCRPPRNRLADAPDAIVACDEWVVKELDVYNPSVVVLTGNTSARLIFGVTTNITAIRGTVRSTIGNSKFPYGSRLWVPTWHPSFVLRAGGLNSGMAKQSIADITLAKELL